MVKILCQNERAKPNAGFSQCNKIIFFSNDPGGNFDITTRCSGCKAYVNIKGKNGKIEFSAVEKPGDIGLMKEPYICVERQLFQL